MHEPMQRCSARLAAKKQAVPSFADCPQLILSAIHDILLHGSDDDEGFCRPPGTRDAACFRATCKAFYNAVGPLPNTLKLSFDDPPSQERTQSLAFMLSRPIAAHTQLSLRLGMQHSKLPVLGPRNMPSSASQFFGDEDHQPWAQPLTALTQRVERLEMPSLFVDTTVSAACQSIPSLKELVLHVGSYTEMGYLHLMSDSDEEEDEFYDYIKACFSQSQLRCLTLSVPSGQSPFTFIGDDPLLILSDLPLLESLVLRGPIVQDDFDDGVPFRLRPETKVVIDPGLGSRRPTQWARSLTVYDRFDAMPGSAVPDVREYQEEDLDARCTNMANFREKIADLACEGVQNPLGLYSYTGVLDGVGFLDDDCVRDMMEMAGVAARSDLLERAYSAQKVAQIVRQNFEDYQRSMEMEAMEEMAEFCEECGSYHW